MNWQRGNQKIQKWKSCAVSWIQKSKTFKKNEIEVTSNKPKIATL
jgi:hypothetical protein